MQNELYIGTGEILLPGENVYLPAWACVACDQFTSQPEYWRQADEVVGGMPSTLRLILPECYLAEAPQRIPKLHAAMDDYLSSGVVQGAVENGFVLVERSTGSGARVGLVALLDLEGYDYRPGSKSLIRATESTIESRIPPRLAVREGASLELSHVLVLLDDTMHSVVEPLYEKRGELTKLYDFPLMLEGGHISGWAVTESEDVAGVYSALEALKSRLQGDNAMLYAVGDGNHSLAAAKAYWDKVKQGLTEDEAARHPARFAMAELTNLYDDALEFEPIHRVLFGYDGDALLSEMAEYFSQRGISLSGGESAQELDCVYEGKHVRLNVCGARGGLAVGALDDFLDWWLPRHPLCHVDYVHGEDAVRAIAAGEGVVGFLAPRFDKGALFGTVAGSGPLPRKTFSMGHAREKRYYMETRRLSR